MMGITDEQMLALDTDAYAAWLRAVDEGREVETLIELRGYEEMRDSKDVA